MRDDIHKRAPGGRKWASVVRAATRNADWESGTVRALENALIAEIRKEDGTKMLQKLESTRDLFGANPQKVAFGNSQFQRVLQEVLLGHGAPSSLRACVVLALRRLAGSWERELVARTAADKPSDIRILRHRIASGMAKVRLETIASAEINGERRPKLRRVKIDVDEPISNILARAKE